MTNKFSHNHELEIGAGTTFITSIPFEERQPFGSDYIRIENISLIKKNLKTIMYKTTSNILNAISLTASGEQSNDSNERNSMNDIRL